MNGATELEVVEEPVPLVWAGGGVRRSERRRKENVKSYPKVWDL